MPRAVTGLVLGSITGDDSRARVGMGAKRATDKGFPRGIGGGSGSGEDGILRGGDSPSHPLAESESG